MNFLKKYFVALKKELQTQMIIGNVRLDINSCMKDCAKLEYRLIELETKVTSLELFVKHMNH